MISDGSKKFKVCYEAKKSHSGFDVYKNILETVYDGGDEFFCTPTQAKPKKVAHFESDGEVQFFDVSDKEQQQIMVFVRKAVLC